MSGIRIRKAGKKDADEILDLLYQLQRPRPKTSSEKTAFRKKISQYLESKDRRIIVAEQDSRVVGLASAMLLPRLNRTRLELYIPELVVSESHRGQGVGVSLIGSCVSMAERKKCFRIRLESGNRRRGAHRFYKKIGFEQSALSYTMAIRQRQQSG